VPSETISREALPSRYHGDRSFSTAIYFLLPAGAVSRLHRIASDEIWHFYLGGPLELLQISPNRKSEKLILVLMWQRDKDQHVVPSGFWWAPGLHRFRLIRLVDATVAPGFDFADFELANAEDLSRTFPGPEGGNSPVI